MFGKRQSTLNKNCDVKRKKLHASMTCFEDLANEICYEIFDYLDGCDIYNAFSNLNHRFKQLISSPTFLLRITPNTDSFFSMSKDWCRYVIISNRHRIISLHLSDSDGFLLDDLLRNIIIDETFSRLESIVLVSCSTRDLMEALFYFKSLPRLFALTVNVKENDYRSVDFHRIYRMILHLPYLKYNSLTSKQWVSDDLIPLAVNERFSTIEYLILEHRCTSEKLVSILSHTPRLHHLTCDELSEVVYDHKSEVSLMLPHLTYLSIRKCRLKFQEFKDLMKKIASHLTTFYLWEFFDEHYTDPNQWEELISINIPRLQRFRLKWYGISHRDFTKFYLNSFVDHFKSEFWIKRECFFELEIQSKVVGYSISSRRYHKIPNRSHCPSDRQSTNNTLMTFSPSINLIITDQHGMNLERSFIDELSPILLAMPFTSLFLSYNNLSIDAVVKIIHLLPHLHSLKFSYISLENFTSLTSEDPASLRLISQRSKITKISQPVEFKLMHLLIKFSPQLEHLELYGVEEKDLEKIVGRILQKQLKRIPQLRSICLHMYYANDQTQNDLQNIIDSKKLFLNYHLNRWCNDIFLQWYL